MTPEKQYVINYLTLSKLMTSNGQTKAIQVSQQACSSS